MDTARQVVRWSIPGSVLVLVALGVNVTAAFYRRLFHGATRVITVDSGVVALFALATIPLGYLVYQVYYSREGRVRRYPPSLIPVDRGHFILSLLDPALRAEALDHLGAPGVDWSLFTLSSNSGGRLVQQPAGAREATWPPRAPSWLHYRLHYHQLAVEGTRPAGRRRWKDLLARDAEFYRQRRHDRARYYFNSQRHVLLVRTLLAMVAMDDRGKALTLEYTSLSDIYHGLGATRTALALGVPVGGVVSLIGPTRSWDASILATLIVGIFAAGFYLAAHVNRAEVLRRLIGTAHLGLTYVLASQVVNPKAQQAILGNVP